MTPREKIIVGLMVLTVGYGAVELLLPGSKASSPPAPAAAAGEPLNVFITKIADAVRAGGPGGDLLLQRAESEWARNPFLEIRGRPGGAGEEKAASGRATAPSPPLLYSGFIEAGGRRIAIINGMEYEPGDRLATGGFVVKAVRPNQVIVSSPQGEVVIPLKETE